MVRQTKVVFDKVMKTLDSVVLVREHFKSAQMKSVIVQRLQSIEVEVPETSIEGRPADTLLVTRTCWPSYLLSSGFTQSQSNNFS